VAEEMDSHIFRRSRWVIDLNDDDADRHLTGIRFGTDERLLMKYFVYLLYETTSKLGTNEFVERHEEIKDAIIDIMRKKIDSGARQLSALIEGMVRKSLQNDNCLDHSKPYPKWIGPFHTHSEPINFYQLLEGALGDPRARIGRYIDYPPEEEIFHVSEMIRNPLAHGASTIGTFEDYKVLFFILVLLFHDLVNPHNQKHNAKYIKWLNRTRVNMRLAGVEPTTEEIEKQAAEQGLDLEELRTNLQYVA
jgi:hypothetical protein